MDLLCACLRRGFVSHIHGRAALAGPPVEAQSGYRVGGVILADGPRGSPSIILNLSTRRFDISRFESVPRRR